MLEENIFLAPQARAQLLPASMVLARRDAMQRSAHKKFCAVATALDLIKSRLPSKQRATQAERFSASGPATSGKFA